MLTLFTLYALELQNFIFHEDVFRQKSKEAKNQYIFGGIYPKISQQIKQISTIWQGSPQDSSITSSGKIFNFDDHTIALHRQITPAAQGESYFVQDSLTISIDAHLYLNKLHELNLISLKSISLDAFIGIKFKREYKYIYTAPNYHDAITAPINSFLTILRVFLSNQFKDLNYGDHLSFGQYFDNTNKLNANVAIHSLLSNKLELSVYQNNLSEIAINYHSQGSDIQFNVLQDGKNSFTTSLETDFFTLLGLTIFSLSTGNTKLKKTQLFLSLSSQELEDLSLPENREKKKIFRQLFNFNFTHIDHPAIKNNIVEKKVFHQQSSQVQFKLLNHLTSANEKKEKSSIIRQDQEVQRYLYQYQQSKINYSLLFSCINFIGKSFLKNFMAGKDGEKGTDRSFTLEQENNGEIIIKIKYHHFSIAASPKSINFYNQYMAQASQLSSIIIEGLPIYLESTLIVKDDQFLKTTTPEMIDHLCAPLGASSYQQSICMWQVRQKYDALLKEGNIDNWYAFLKVVLRYHSDINFNNYLFRDIASYGKIEQNINKMNYLYLF